MHEDGFLRILNDDPADVATLLVYADWLDDQGEAERSGFLRLQHRINQLPKRDRIFRALCRKLRELGEQLDAQWVGVVSRPRLTGTVWANSGRARRGMHVVRFLAGGALNYTSPAGTFQNGSWRQVGPVVLLETNGHYADYVGMIHADRICGSASNIVKANWRWDVRRTNPETS